MSLVFINYRRSDSQHAALGLHSHLSARFGQNRVFLDVSSIEVGSVWPERLRSALDISNVMFCVIGSEWLKAANQYGQRKIDDQNDWVRNEIAYSLRNSKPIIPLLLTGGLLPPREGLPLEIQDLVNYQVRSLRDDYWYEDIQSIVNVLCKSHGFVENQRRVILPSPEVKIEPLTTLELDQELAKLNGWEPVETIIPGDYPNSRLELRKTFTFRSFKKAVEFMNSSVELINKHKHHPRWENQWRTVTVHLTTWDIGNKISILDINLAKDLDRFFAEQRSSLHE